MASGQEGFDGFATWGYEDDKFSNLKFKTCDGTKFVKAEACNDVEMNVMYLCIQKHKYFPKII